MAQNSLILKLVQVLDRNRKNYIFRINSVVNIQVCNLLLAHKQTIRLICAANTIHEARTPFANTITELADDRTVL